MVRNEHLPKGANFTRALLALAASKGLKAEATAYAAARWGSASRAAEVVKAAVTAGDLGGLYRSAATEWTNAVRERSIIGRARFRRSRFYVRTRALSDNVSAAWVSEGEARPVSVPSWDVAELQPHSLSAMVVATMESVKEGGTEFEDALRAELTRAAAEAADAALLDPDNDGSGKAPASMLNGAPSVELGASIDDALAELVAAFEGDLTQATFVTSPEVAVALHSADRPNIGIQGGELLGAPVLTTRGAPEGVLALIDPSRILVAMGEVDIRASEQGTFEAEEGEGHVSLFQANCIALRAELAAAWRVERKAAAYLTGIGE